MRWCSRVVLVKVLVSCKCPFPITRATVQSILGVTGTITCVAGLSGFLELTVAWRRVSANLAFGNAVSCR